MPPVHEFCVGVVEPALQKKPGLQMVHLAAPSLEKAPAGQGFCNEAVRSIVDHETTQREIQEASRGMDGSEKSRNVDTQIMRATSTGEIRPAKKHTCVGDTAPDRQLCPAAQRTELTERPAVGHAKPGAHGVGDDEPAGQ